MHSAETCAAAGSARFVIAEASKWSATREVIVAAPTEKERNPEIHKKDRQNWKMAKNNKNTTDS